ncbi:MAG: ComF family protein [Victivallales bacterium]|nr:ComF family protein [Victivallales bacterium]
MSEILSSHLLSSFMDFLAPPVCPFCEKDVFEGEDGICGKCASDLPQFPEKRCPGCGGPLDGILNLCEACADSGPRPWTRAVSAFPFFGQIRHALHRFKYRNKISLAPFFGRQMALAWLEHGMGDIDAVSYIPLHWMRFMERGYNQAELLAAQVARHLELDTLCTLRRTRSTGRQATLGKTDRLQNLRGAFKPYRTERFAGKNILLVDDVFTTGSTLAEATRTLLKSGAASVSVLTIARD